MDKRTFEKLGVTASALGMGCMRLPTDAQGSIRFAEGRKIIDDLHGVGVTYFDTAWMYHDGTSEDFLKKALVERYPRDSFTIADKFPVWEAETPEDVERIFYTQLKRLGADCIDFYLLHSLNGRHWNRCKELGAYEFQRKLRDEGKIKYMGFSFHGTTGELEQILREAPFDFVQLQMNYYDWEDFARDQYKVAEKYELPVVVMEPVRGGSLANPPTEVAQLLNAVEPGQSPAQLALRWVAALPNVKVVLSGMSDSMQARENAAIFSPFVPLDKRQLEVIEKARRVILARPTIPCTGCNYCGGCSAGVVIPKIFEAYNEYVSFESVPAARWHYIENLRGDQRAHNCVQCGACLEMCPQSIDIPKELTRVLACFKEVGVLE